MPDKEQLIQIFEHAIRKAWGEGFDYIDLSPSDGKKILELLKEQEQILVHSRKYYGVMYAECPKCHEKIDSLVNKNFCGNCGQAVKWE